MLIVSWNVAGLGTTVNRIHDHMAAAEGRHSIDEPADAEDPCGPDRKKVKRSNSHVNSNSNKNACSALATFFERHQADIICLQEHKIPKSQLVNRTEPRQLSHVPGYESFWSCCVDENSRGMNGVCTYARTGSVIKADASPLTLALGDDMNHTGSDDISCCDDLNRQGRCVKTDHGTFVLFNVYVPASGGQPLRIKMKFLNALRSAMHKVRRDEHKPVILVGDLNITHRPLDVYWSDRVVYVDHVIDEVRQHRNRLQMQLEESVDPTSTVSTVEPLPQWKLDVAEHWGRIRRALSTLRAVQTTTRNTKTNQEFTKFRAVVTVDDTNDNDDGLNPTASQNQNVNMESNVSHAQPSNSRQIFLGKHESDETWCLMSYQVLEPDIHQLDGASTNDVVVTRPANVVSVGVLAELLNKIGGVSWPEHIQRDIADNYAGVVKESLPRKWLNAVVEEDGMVDAFRHFYPIAEGRFTCWHQFTNRRYYNEGIRIDYTLVDRSLLDQVHVGDVQGLRCCGNATDPHHLTEEAALAAATANGRFQPVSFEGGGIQEATMDALDTQFGTPHTGMIYTPPSFSDHIGISVVLEDTLLRTDLVLDTKDPATKKAQPHKLQTSIASFFGSAATGKSAPASKLPQPTSNSVASGPQQRTFSLGSSARSSTSVVVPNGPTRAISAPVATSTAKSKPSASSVRKPTTSSTKAPQKNSILNHFRRSGESK